MCVEKKHLMLFPNHMRCLVVIQYFMNVIDVCSQQAISLWSVTLSPI